MALIDDLKKQIQENPVILYMKGTPEIPQCGFSAQAVAALNACGKPYASVDVLANPEVRQTLPQVADWPTFPQLYIRGELVGGCDIILELFEGGELQQMIEDAVS
ncbi:MAG: Grx4 family monothiol glutaredoxin [Gammaproteobacteria bacterium]